MGYKKLQDVGDGGGGNEAKLAYFYFVLGGDFYS